LTTNYVFLKQNNVNIRNDLLKLLRYDMLQIF
jgi:hypothetical protein